MLSAKAGKAYMKAKYFFLKDAKTRLKNFKDQKEKQ